VATALLTLPALNRMNREEVRQSLGGVFEQSPWVAERAWSMRPFGSVDELHAAMTTVVRQASRTEQLALLRAHPDLAGKAARAGAMTGASIAEQSSAGLDRLSDEEYARFGRLNAAYRERFGFPFIIAVRKHEKAAILAAFDRRLGHTTEEEIEAALEQVFDITRLRLHRLVRTP
jgi:2-oxo-4-hydroxy-4-carboxy-5-ureidoimidazoline decarboxylase